MAASSVAILSSSIAFEVVVVQNCFRGRNCPNHEPRIASPPQFRCGWGETRFLPLRISSQPLRYQTIVSQQGVSRSQSPLPAKSARGGALVFKFSSLEQRSWSALPRFAFFHGHVFHVRNIRPGLRQHMMQIVADADEGKSLFEKFPDAGRAKQKQSEDDIILTRVLDQLLRRAIKFRRGIHVRELVLVV